MKECRDDAYNQGYLDGLQRGVDLAVGWYDAGISGRRVMGNSRVYAIGDKLKRAVRLFAAGKFGNAYETVTLIRDKGLSGVI